MQLSCLGQVGDGSSQLLGPSLVREPRPQTRACVHRHGFESTRKGEIALCSVY